MKKSLVSILMATLNTAPYIEEAIQSALHQTYSNIELIIVNDGSTDESEKKINSYLKDGRVKYFAWKNQGVSKARNEAFRRSNGEYITFLDGDDFYSKEKIEKQVKFLDAYSEYGAVYCRFLSFYDQASRKYLHYTREFPMGDIRTSLVKHNLINPNVIMMRRKVFESVGGFDPLFRDAEDWDMWLRMSFSGVKFGFIDKELHYNRLRMDSHSRFNNQYKMKLSNVKSFERIVNQLSENERKRFGVYEALRRAHTKLAFAYLVVGRRSDFERELKIGLQGTPWIFFYYPLIVLFRFIPMKFMSQCIQKLWAFKQAKLLGV